MNSLSWMIYLADVVGGINGVFVATSGTAAVAAVVAGAFVFIEGEGPRSYSYDKEEVAQTKRLTWDANIAAAKKVRNRAPIVALAAATLAALIPSSSTVYAIAASELGENVLRSNTASKAMMALDAWLDRQIAQEQPQ